MRPFVTLFVGLVLISRSAAAQRVGHVAIEGTLGLAHARSGIPFTGSALAATDAALTVRLFTRPGHTPIAGVSTSGFYRGGSDASCTILPEGSCAPHLPGFSSRSMMFGWEAISQQKESIRLMIGPSWITRHYSDTTSLGVHVRMDLGTHMRGRLGAVVSGRCYHLPSFRERPMNLLAFGFGFRLN